MGKGRRISYSPKELSWMKTHCAMPRREAHAEFCRLFGRRDISVENFKRACLKRGWTTGRTGFFHKGQAPHNKGQRMPYRENCAKTQFKTGHLPHNTRALGHERVTKDGYVEISISKTNPYTGFERRYVLKHKHLWEQQHGPVPAGHVLKSLDGNRLNTHPSNWTLIPRGLLPLLNGHRGLNYDLAAADVKPVILTLAKLKRVRFAKTATIGGVR